MVLTFIHALQPGALSILIQDEYRGLGPFQIVSLTILGGGAWAYLRQTHPSSRLLVLLAALGLAIPEFGLGMYLLYPQQPWAAHTTFPRWWEATNPLMYGVALMVILVAPAMLKLLPSSTAKSNVAPT